MLEIHWSNLLWGRKVHGHYIPKHALNGVLVSALLETIVPALLRGRRTPSIPRYMETLMATNLSVENQNELENWLAKYLCELSWRLRNFSREVGRLTTKNTQGTIWVSRRLTDCWNYVMHSPVWLLIGGIRQWAISAGNGCKLSDCIVQFSTPTVTVPHNCAMQDWRTVTGHKCVFLEGKT